MSSRNRPHSARIDSLWGETFDATYVITTRGAEARLNRLVETLPIAADRLIVDTCDRGFDPWEHRQETNHHVIVGNRHKRIIDKARRAGHRNLFILEDDAEFLPGTDDKLERVLRWVGRHENRWDVFYLGFLAPFLTRTAWRNRDVVQLTRPLQTHAIGYGRRAFDAILALDFTEDHRPYLFKTLESLTSPDGRKEGYFRDGVGSIDSWLSYSRLRRLGSHPMLVVQSHLPPGTEDNWERRTGRKYDYLRTPNEMLRISLATHYAAVGILLLTVAIAVWLVAFGW